MAASPFNRRRFLKTTAAASAAAVAAPYIRTSYAAGSLHSRLLGPLGAGRERCADQASARSGRRRRRSTLKIDYITSQGNKIVLTIAAAKRRRSPGHDLMHLQRLVRARPTPELLEPVDDIMAAAIKANGAARPRRRVPGEEQGPLGRACRR